MAATAVYLSPGATVDYTPSSAVTAGDVIVQGDLVGVATQAIAASVLGALAVAGRFLFPKGVTSTDALTAGSKVYWNASSEVVTTTVGSNKYVGKVVTAAAAATATVEVRLEQ